MGVPEKALIAADEIVEYIPQRPPIVMADAFYGIGEDGCARSGLTVCEDNILTTACWLSRGLSSISPSRPPCAQDTWTAAAAKRCGWDISGP